MLCVTEELLLSDRIPCRIALLVRDLVAYRNRVQVSLHNSIHNSIDKKQGFVNVLFHNKGMDMINLPSILHNKRVVASVPTYLNNIAPPIVSYTYPKTEASKVFNFKQATSNLNFEIGTVNMPCNCSTSPYIYAPAGHIVTGNFGIIKDKHVRKLLTKGPTYREQNNINWNRNEEICLEAIRKYRVKWAKNENIDVRVLSDWKQVLKTSEHLEYVKGFQEQYVLVPADKAASNIIVICKKHYLDMILSELTLNGSNTYIDSNLDCNTLISRHIHDIKHWNISIPLIMQGLPSFYCMVT